MDPRRSDSPHTDDVGLQGSESSDQGLGVRLQRGLGVEGYGGDVRKPEGALLSREGHDLIRGIWGDMKWFLVLTAPLRLHCYYHLFSWS